MDGARGITYLLFLHREAKISDIQKELIANRIVRNEDTIYDYVRKFEKDKIIRIVRVEQGPGPPKIRTANPEVIYQSIQKHIFRVEPPSSTPWHDTKEKLQILFTKATHVVHDFPLFLKITLELNEQRAADLRWNDTLAIFLSFCEQFARACWIIHRFGRPKIQTKYQSSLREIQIRSNRTRGSVISDELTMYKINWLNQHIMYQFIESRLTDEDILAVGSLIESPDDVFRDGSFLQRVCYTIVNLQRVGLASQIWFRQTMSMAAMKRRILTALEGRYDKRLRDLVSEYGDQTLVELVRDAVATV